MRRANAWTWLISLGVCALGLGACETPLDRAWSLSQREHLALTIENPDAGADELEAPRPDGPSADAALDKFRSNEAEGDRGERPSVIDVGS